MLERRCAAGGQGACLPVVLLVLSLLLLLLLLLVLVLVLVLVLMVLVVLMVVLVVVGVVVVVVVVVCGGGGGVICGGVWGAVFGGTTAHSLAPLTSLPAPWCAVVAPPCRHPPVPRSYPGTCSRWACRRTPASTCAAATSVK